MDSLKKSILTLSLCFLNSCSLPYLFKSSVGQLSILSNREPINEVLKKSTLNEKHKLKLKLTLKAKKFAVEQLKLKVTKSYSSYVQLDRDYVTYLLRVAPAFKFESYSWSFLFAGKFPYKGFFSLEDAKEEAKKFPESEYDTYIRGVAAYSTLGWFNDPLLSPMLRYHDFDLVSTIIHECIHETLFIKDNTSFNEKLANFLGDKGAEIYYQSIDGGEEVLKKIAAEEIDKKLFSNFISKEIKDLKEWYNDNSNINLETKTKRLKLIQKRFTKTLKPKLKTNIYNYFTKIELNNARLLPYDTYIRDMSIFEDIYKIYSSDFIKSIAYFKSLSNSKDPISDMKNKIKEYNEQNN